MIERDKASRSRPRRPASRSTRLSCRSLTESSAAIGDRPHPHKDATPSQTPLS